MSDRIITMYQSTKVSRLSLERLEALGEALLDFKGLEDLDAWFELKQ